MIPTLPTLQSAINPVITHWANANCMAWWIARPGLTGGTTVLDALSKYRLTLNLVGGGSDSRALGPWSPSSGTYGGNYTNSPRPGALTNQFLGPFTYGLTPTTWYASSTLSINTVCPTAGTMCYWLLPQDNYTSGLAYGIAGQISGAAPPYFSILRSTDTHIYHGFVSSTTDYRSIVALTAANYTPGKWTHWTITWRANDFTRVYTNGVLAASGATPNPSTLTQPGGLFLIGRYLVTPFYYSAYGFDDFTIWGYQMSAAQVAQVYQQSYLGWPGRLEAQLTWFRSPISKHTRRNFYRSAGGRSAS